VHKFIASQKKKGYQCEEGKRTKQLNGWVYRDLPSTGNANGIRGRHTFRIDEQILPGVCIRDLSKYFRVHIRDLSKYCISETTSKISASVSEPASEIR
jgi:hypothetical protein